MFWIFYFLLREFMFVNAKFNRHPMFHTVRPHHIQSQAQALALLWWWKLNAYILYKLCFPKYNLDNNYKTITKSASLIAMEERKIRKSQTSSTRSSASVNSQSSSRTSMSVGVGNENDIVEEEPESDAGSDKSLNTKNAPQMSRAQEMRQTILKYLKERKRMTILFQINNI